GLHAVLEGDEEAPARAGGPRLRRLAVRAPEPEDDRALPLLELGEARHGGGEAQVVRVGGVDAGDERLGDALERPSTEPSSDARAQALVGGNPTWQHELERHPELARSGKGTRGD